MFEEVLKHVVAGKTRIGLGSVGTKMRVRTLQRLGLGIHGILGFGEWNLIVL